MTKEELCRKFVNNPGDDIYQIVEELVEMRDEDCPCVFPSVKPCSKTATSTATEPNCFGFCKAHLKTRKGNELALLWNQLLEELNIEESEEEEKSQPEPEAEESAPDEEDEEVPQPEPEPPKPRRGRPPGPTKGVATPPKKPVPAEPNIQIEKPPRAKPKPKPAKSEESSVAEGSARTAYVSQDEEENNEEEASPLPPLQFHKGKFGNYVNDEHKLVLRHRDKTILGTENSTGGIVSLTPKDIAICKKHNLQYI